MSRRDGPGRSGLLDPGRLNSKSWWRWVGESARVWLTGVRVSGRGGVGCLGWEREMVVGVNRGPWRVAAVVGVVVLVAAACVPPSAGGPFDISVKVGDGSGFVNSNRVRVSVSAPDGVVEMRVANGADAKAGRWKPFRRSVQLGPACW